VPRVAVNVSPSQLQREGFVAEILDLLQLPGADPEALELEITESLIMQNIENSNRALSVLRGAGIHVAMDDFGTGYSSLRYLASLPVDKIKIDRSFVAGMTESALDGKVVSTIISLAHSFGLPVVAEGVETVEQAKVLHALDCDEAQGFLFSPPLPARRASTPLSVPVTRAFARDSA
jgi:EAL domain-containing protein (putative c-di-GMP-specific phosphodiesterase class I)